MVTTFYLLQINRNTVLSKWNNSKKTNKDVVENPNEIGFGFEKFLATDLVLTFCNRCGCNRLVVIIVVVVITKVSAVVTIVEVDTLVAVQFADLEGA